MLVFLNEQPIELQDTCSLGDFLVAHNYTHTGFATMVNKIFVPRANYQATLLADGDRINIILPNQGG